MDAFLETFERHEKKYLLDGDHREALMERIGSRLIPDAHFASTVCSLYCDTPDHVLVNRSLESPLYKEKLRLRSYGVAAPGDPVFIEIKKKFKGVVYKRRVGCSIEAARAYLVGMPFDAAIRRYPLADASLQEQSESARSRQIVSEVDFMRGRYQQLEPRMVISTERVSYLTDDACPLRFTFDTDILWRTDHLDLGYGIAGNRLLGLDEALMEVKCAGAYPAWLTAALDGLGIYPRSFSKYGRAYQRAYADGVEPAVQRARLTAAAVVRNPSATEAGTARDTRLIREGACCA